MNEDLDEFVQEMIKKIYGRLGILIDAGGNVYEQNLSQESQNSEDLSGQRQETSESQ